MSGLNRAKLVDEIYTELNLSNTPLLKKSVDKVIDMVMLKIKQTVNSGETVRLRGLGTFSKRERLGRKGVNPSTQEKIYIPAKNVVKFRPSKAFERGLNAK